jgi:hypothetical protein
MGGICNPDKPLKKPLPKRKKQLFRNQGKKAGHRYRGKPKMTYANLLDWKLEPFRAIATPNRNALYPTSPTSAEMWDTHGYIQNWYNPLVKEEFVGGSGEPYKHIVDLDNVELVKFGKNISLRESIRATCPFLNSAQLDELALRSEEKLSQVVDSQTSLFNFLIELYHAITGHIGGTKRFQSIYSKCVKAFQREYERLIKAGHKQAAARWLAWNFAIKPAISDLRNILCSMTAANKKLKWLIAHNRKIVYMDYHRKDLGREVENDGSFRAGQWLAGIGDANLFSLRLNDPPNGSFDTYVRYTDIDLQYHARSKIYLDIPDEYLKGVKGLGILWEAMMGLHNPIGIIWEATPFSWLIDYFLSYRARLFQRMFDYNPYNQGVEVLGYGHSFTLHVKGDAKIINLTPLGLEIDHENLGGFRYQIKWRRAGLPFPEETTLFRVPDSWYKASIIGAIGIGLLPGRRSH